MYKRRKNQKLIYYFNRLSQDNKDYILSLMVQLFRKQYQINYEKYDTKSSDNLIYFFNQ